ncbi:MAG: hypothetical protein WB460_21790 [Candidatus Acidiferrales bacterium]
MARDLLDLLCRATNEMRDFARREQEFAADPSAIDAAVVKSLTARLREVGEATRAGRPEEISRAHASSAYSEYKDLIALVQTILKPFHDRLVVRQDETI